MCLSFVYRFFSSGDGKEFLEAFDQFCVCPASKNYTFSTTIQGARRNTFTFRCYQSQTHVTSPVPQDFWLSKILNSGFCLSKLFKPGFWPTIILKSAKILNSAFQLTKILKSAKMLNSGFLTFQNFDFTHTLKFRIFVSKS